MLKIIKNHSILILVVVLAAAIRFYAVDKVPPSLNWDEISHGYNAYSILKSGKDEWGILLPSIFRAYGDYKLPVYIYATALSEMFFGLNAFAVRLPSVLAGISTVVGGYLLVFYLFKSKKEAIVKNIALLTAFLIALEPWTLFISRAAFEANLGITLFVWATVFLLKYHITKKPVQVYISMFLYGLTVWTYNSFRIFTPLFLVFAHVNYLAEFRLVGRDTRFKSFLIAGLFLIPMFIQLLNPSGSARYSKVSILDEGAISRIEELRRQYPRIVANKFTYLAVESAKNYIAYFDPRFLFLTGGDQYQFSIPNTGLLYLIASPFLLIGLWFVVKQSLRDRDIRLLLIWLLLAPIVGSITRDAPHVLRSVTLLPIPMLLTAWGVYKAAMFTKRRFGFTNFILIFVLAVFLSTEGYVKNYFENYTRKYSQSWQFGYKEVSEFINQNKDNYAKIVMTKKYGEPHEFLLFYAKYDPVQYREDKNLNRFNQSGWWWVDGFDKFYFVNDWDIPKEGYKFIQESKKTIDCRQAKCLLITAPGNAPKGWNIIKTVNFLDGTIAFELYENI